MTHSTLRSLELARIDIPFRIRFAHASADRDRTESVLVAATTAAGTVGYGEGCPRSYVTGEKLASVHRFFAEHANAILAEVADVESLRGFIAFLAALTLLPRLILLWRPFGVSHGVDRKSTHSR